MVQQEPKVSRSPFGASPFEASYAPQGPVWRSQSMLNPLLSPELKMQILVTEVFDQLSDSITHLESEKP